MGFTHIKIEGGLNMEKTKLIQEIIFLAMLVQERNGHCVFVNFSGHVESMDISIRKSKKDYC
jgi:2-keto-4-pentenoate hydratase/2-oxohepta-3-ene-1,7-dioic acid hydratase in catechol pathway